MKNQSPWKVIATSIEIKSWGVQTPTVDEVRPARCVACGSASRPVGGKLVLHGHGTVKRQVRGPLEVGGKPEIVEFDARRYQCQQCSAVMTVVPAGVLAGYQYTAPAIAFALFCWVVQAFTDAQVRDLVCPWRIRGTSPRGWAQLYRWARRAATLFVLPRPVRDTGTVREVVGEVLRVLLALGPPTRSPAHRVFAGAGLLT